ncbi:MAG TPA: hypothetical protein VKE71_00615, partial [Candidatus Angelobacter sp.]|nr:hypothetical protein [Candidatus Angelobacter sp.]
SGPNNTTLKLPNPESGKPTRKNLFHWIWPAASRFTGTAGGSIESDVPGGSGRVEASSAGCEGTATLICGALHEGQKVVPSSTVVPQR